MTIATVPDFIDYRDVHDNTTGARATRFTLERVLSDAEKAALLAKHGNIIFGLEAYYRYAPEIRHSVLYVFPKNLPPYTRRNLAEKEAQSA